MQHNLHLFTNFYTDTAGDLPLKHVNKGCINKCHKKGNMLHRQGSHDTRFRGIRATVSKLYIYIIFIIIVIQIKNFTSQKIGDQCRMSQDYQTLHPILWPSTMVDQIHGMVTFMHKQREHRGKTWAGK